MTRTLPNDLPPTASIPVQTERPPWRDTLAALRVPNFRLFTSTNLLAMTASWMQRIAQDWLVFELSHSVAAVGFTVAMQFAPMLLFGLLGGVIVDRRSKRMLMIATQSMFAVLSVVLAVLTLTGVVEVWHIYVLAFAIGLVTVIDNPARQVFVNELVGPQHLRNAISINSSIFQLGGMIGPAVSAVLLLSVGAGWSFAINALACAIVVATLFRIRTSALIATPPSPASKGQLREGISYALGKPAIRWTLVLIAFFSVFALTMPVLLAAYASEVFDVGAGGYGFFNTMIAVGSLAGALASTRRAGIRLRTVVSAAGAAGLFTAAAGFAPNIAVFSALLIAVGFATLSFLTAANSLVQMSSNMGIRGRVMSLYVLLLLGGQALGGPLVGFIVERFGVHTGMVLAGGVPVLAAVVVGLVLARRGHLRLALRIRRSLPQVRIVTTDGRTA
ncbi:MFS transporter [Planctomonas psychrotolerans]|uniref:MFS transporter n=1 Tax=Planctomonas psychrotolerans TaxID=2528712 RepID=UPI001D0D6B5E|nr:MFS transporter [Planctomonas psychrotolerans]